MNLKFLVPFLCCFVYCLAQSSGDKCELGHPENISPSAPKKCCNIKQIYDKAAETECLNKYQNVISNINTGIRGKFDGLECFFWCLFDKAKVFNNNRLNVPAFKAYAANVLKDPVWTPVVNNAIDFCNNQAIANEANLTSSMGGKNIDNNTECNPRPIFIGSCILFQQIINCPEAEKPKNISSINECKLMENYYKECPVLRLHSPRGRTAAASPRSG